MKYRVYASPVLPHLPVHPLIATVGAWARGSLDLTPNDMVLTILCLFQF